MTTAADTTASRVAPVGCRVATRTAESEAHQDETDGHPAHEGPARGSVGQTEGGDLLDDLAEKCLFVVGADRHTTTRPAAPNEPAR